VATAFARRVLPVPGGPNSNTPLHGLEVAIDSASLKFLRTPQWKKFASLSKLVAGAGAGCGSVH
jgi:hypothetical protein